MKARKQSTQLHSVPPIDDEKKQSAVSQAARLHVSQFAALRILDLCEGVLAIDPDALNAPDAYATVVTAIANRVEALAEIAACAAGEGDLDEEGLDGLILDLNLSPHQSIHGFKRRWENDRMPWADDTKSA